jgi:transcriptional regulator with XRE-family HTH domain
MITSGQIRAARALLGLSQAALARAADVSVPTIKRCESDSPNVSGVAVETRDRIRAELERAGVEFTNGDMPGVRLKKAPG